MAPQMGTCDSLTINSRIRLRGTFEKTGLSLPLDGTEDDTVSFDGSGVHPISVDSEDPETEFAGEIDSSDHRISFKQQ